MAELKKRKTKEAPAKPITVREDNFREVASIIITILSISFIILVWVLCVKKKEVAPIVRTEIVHDTIYLPKVVINSNFKKLKKVTYERDSLLCRVAKLEYDSIKFGETNGQAY